MKSQEFVCVVTLIPTGWCHQGLNVPCRMTPGRIQGASSSHARFIVARIMLQETTQCHWNDVNIDDAVMVYTVS